MNEEDKNAHEALDIVLGILNKELLNEFDISTKYKGYNVDIKITKKEK